MRAATLQPSSRHCSSFLKEIGSKAGSSHFNEKFSFFKGHHCVYHVFVCKYRTTVTCPIFSQQTKCQTLIFEPKYLCGHWAL